MLQVIVQPHQKHVIVQTLEQHADEGDEWAADDPTGYLLRQARRIKNGEHVERITTLLPL